jgi:hypothetical protein
MATLFPKKPVVGERFKFEFTVSLFGSWTHSVDGLNELCDLSFQDQFGTDCILTELSYNPLRVIPDPDSDINLIVVEANGTVEEY